MSQPLWSNYNAKTLYGRSGGCGVVSASACASCGDNSATRYGNTTNFYDAKGNRIALMIVGLKSTDSPLEYMAIMSRSDVGFVD
jgi:hypothetical protein